MKRKLWYAALAAGLALLTTGCFALQGFSLLDSSLAPGAKTKAQFALRPFDADGGAVTPNKAFQFVMVGVDTSDLGIGGATWGTNGKFGGPAPMVASAQLPGVLTTGSTCSSSALGINLSTASGVTWKGFVTATQINDKNLVDSTAITQVVLKVKPSASTATSHSVIGVTGGWKDNPSAGTVGVPDVNDSFYCTGLSADSLYVK
jgi:hypothetical protein